MASKQFDIRRSKVTTTRDSSTGAYTRTTSLETPPDGNERTSSWKPGHGSAEIMTTLTRLHDDPIIVTGGETIGTEGTFKNLNTVGNWKCTKTSGIDTTYTYFGRTWFKVASFSASLTGIGSYFWGLCDYRDIKMYCNVAYDTSANDTITDSTLVLQSFTTDTTESSTGYKFAKSYNCIFKKKDGTGDDIHISYCYENLMSGVLYISDDVMSSIASVCMFSSDSSLNQGIYVPSPASQFTLDCSPSDFEEGETYTIKFNNASGTTLATETAVCHGRYFGDYPIPHENEFSMSLNDTDTGYCGSLAGIMCMHIPTGASSATTLVVERQIESEYNTDYTAPSRLLNHTDTDLGDANVTETVLKATSSRTTKFADEMMDDNGFIGTGTGYDNIAHVGLAKFSDDNATTTYSSPEDTTAYRLTKGS